MTCAPSTPPRVEARGHLRSLRTARLVVLSLASAGIAFGLYELTYFQTSERPPQPLQIPVIHREFINQDIDAGGSTMLIGEVPVITGNRLEVSILDDALRNKLLLSYEGRRPLDEAGRQWALDRPTLVFFMPEGEKATLRADQGELSVRTSDRLEPRRGRLWGNVRVIVDRTTQRWRAENPEAAHKPTPQSQQVRIWLEALDFDRDHGRITSSGDVRMESAEMQLLGRGLEIRWSDATNRIEYLKIAEGRELVFQSDMRLDLQMAERIATGEGDQPRDPGPGAEEVGRPAEQAPPDASPQEISVADGPQVQVQPENVLIVKLAEGGTQDSPVDSYEVEFSRRVVARQETGGGRLLADRMTVLLDMPAESGASGPRPGQADGGANPPGPEEPAPAASDGPAASVAADPAKSSVHVTWEGPLVIRSVDRQPGDGGALRRRITAEGDPVLAESPDGTVRAARLIRDISTGFTQLTGSQSQRVQMDSGTDMMLSARDVIELDEKGRQARLAGAVEVRMPGSSLAAERVEAAFAQPGPQRRGHGLRDLIERLDCHGDAILRQQGSALSCQHLVVALGPDAEGRNLPRTADASDTVQLQSGTRQLQAQTVHVEFGALPLDDQGQPLARWPRTRAVHARHAVRILDPQRQWDIAGRDLRLTFDEQEVITFGQIVGEDGQDARVELDGYAIAGSSVTFDDARQWAHVPGAGRGRFLMEEDLDGRKLGAAVPVEIQWESHMTMDGPSNLMTFKGGVRAASRNNRLSGDTLEIMLEDATPDAQLAAQAAPADPLGLWILRPYRPEAEALGRTLSRRPREAPPQKVRLTKRAREIVAHGEPAVLESQRYREDGETLLSRMNLRSEQIHFNLDQEVMFVKGGRWSFEEYPDAIAAASAKRSGSLFSAARDESPSQTVMLWDSSMRYYYAQRAVEAESKSHPVRLMHLSGSHIRVNQELLEKTDQPPQRWEQLRSLGTGRKAELSCGRLLVEFQPSSESPGAGQMNFGQLRQLEAQNDVILYETKDGWYISGERVIFVAADQHFEVHGAPGETGFISRVDPDSGRRLEARCPALFLELLTGRVDAPACPTISFGQ